MLGGIPKSRERAGQVADATFESQITGTGEGEEARPRPLNEGLET
jgi:hypothetical protein